MKIRITKDYSVHRNEIINTIQNFDIEGDYIYKGNRNELKIFQLANNNKIVIKSFKEPHLLNAIIYKFFRKSKAQRSYEYAHKLIHNQILTPQPVAFVVFENSIFIKKSFYVCEYIDNALTFKDFNKTFNTDFKEAIQAFAKFTYDLHEKGIHFLDHSSGNTLIKKVNNTFNFYLVDINRMKFNCNLSFSDRINNFSRITTNREYLKWIADAYAELISVHDDIVYNSLLKSVSNFQSKFKRRRNLKKAIKFWKK